MNSIWVSGGQTSKPYKGMQPGRSVRFDNEDYGEVTTRVKGVEYSSARFMIFGNQQVNYGQEWGSFTIRAVHPDHRILERTKVLQGRYINAIDIRDFRKIAVVGTLVKDALFHDAPAIGKEIRINGISFKVVGVFDDDGSEQERELIYLPISTAQRTFNGAEPDQPDPLHDRRRDARRERADGEGDQARSSPRTTTFDPEDQRAVFLMNIVETFQRFLGLMNGIRIFIWIVGIGTLLAGVVGVSNIMLVAVKERTREIGIRKAIGATPGSIVGLVLKESILITAVAGYLGLVLGVAVLETVSELLPKEASFFRDPHVDLHIAGWATVLLIVAGGVAGFFPARRAASVQPVVALRED